MCENQLGVSNTCSSENLKTVGQNDFTNNTVKNEQPVLA